MHSVGCNYVKHAATGLMITVDVFSGVKKQSLPELTNVPLENRYKNYPKVPILVNIAYVGAPFSRAAPPATAVDGAVHISDVVPVRKPLYIMSSYSST